MAESNKDKITTIKVSVGTKERIDKLRAHKRDSYDEILQRLLGILNVCRADPDSAQEKLVKLEQLRKRNSVKG